MYLYSAAVVGIIMLLPEILQLPRTRLFGGEKANNMRSIVKENQRAILLHGLFCIQYFLMLSTRYLCFSPPRSLVPWLLQEQCYWDLPLPFFLLLLLLSKNIFYILRSERFLEVVEQVQFSMINKTMLLFWTLSLDVSIILLLHCRSMKFYLWERE